MSKQVTIQNYIDANVNNVLTTTAICQACNCSLPTVLTFIKNNSFRFEKIKRGTYRVMASTQTLSSDLPSHEW